MKRFTLLLSASLLIMAFISSKETEIIDFSLKNVDGKFVSLKDYPEAKGFVIIFTCNHCPFAKLYPERMNAINSKYKPLGVPLIAISSTDTVSYEADSFIKMVEKSKNEHFNFPYLYDNEQAAARIFFAEKTPHAFIIWKKDGKWVVKYDGAIDDNGMEPEKVTTHYVTNALDELLSGKEVTIKETKSIGCQIYLRKK